MPSIDPTELETTLKVLSQLADIDEEHPDFVAVRRATAKMFKAVKKTRRLEKRAEIAEADRSVIAATVLVDARRPLTLGGQAPSTHAP